MHQLQLAARHAFDAFSGRDSSTTRAEAQHRCHSFQRASACAFRVRTPAPLLRVGHTRDEETLQWRDDKHTNNPIASRRHTHQCAKRARVEKLFFCSAAGAATMDDEMSVGNLWHLSRIMLLDITDHCRRAIAADKSTHLWDVKLSCTYAMSSWGKINCNWEKFIALHTVLFERMILYYVSMFASWRFVVTVI